MTVQITRLDNGIHVISHDLAHLETVSLGIWVRAGARDESEAQNGIAHFLEHMAFKGTSRRSAFQIARDIENVGGDINASTSMETTGYYAPQAEGCVRWNDSDLAISWPDIGMSPTLSAKDATAPHLRDLPR